MIDSADESGEAHVRVLYGSGTGLTIEGNQLWSQATPGVRGRPQIICCNDFGFALAAGDFGEGRQDDLAIGEPGDRKGFVHVLYGSARGLTAAGDEIWSWTSAGMPGAPPRRARFGYSLAASDFGGPSARDDLAIGTGTADHAGEVIVLYAAAGGGGLSPTTLQVWNQDTFGVNGEAEPGDGYGVSLAAGDFDGDVATDLAIGVPGETSATGETYGAVSVLFSRW
jgi:FG-GAP repeat protein